MDCTFDWQARVLRGAGQRGARRPQGGGACGLPSTNGQVDQGFRGRGSSEVARNAYRARLRQGSAGRVTAGAGAGQRGRGAGARDRGARRRQGARRELLRETLFITFCGK